MSQSLGRSLKFHDPLLSVGEGGIELRTELRVKPGATSVPKTTQPTGGHTTWMNGGSLLSAGGTMNTWEHRGEGPVTA